MKLNLQVTGQKSHAGREVIIGTPKLPNHVCTTMRNERNKIIWRYSGLAWQ
jgi:hypothetical protein